MVKVNSSRAQKILETPKHLKREVAPTMRKFPGSEISLWMEMEGGAGFGGDQSVKNLSFSGSLDNIHILVLESMGSLLVNRKISVLETLSVRECEAFLRDRNSEPAFEGWSSEEEKTFLAIFQWLRAWPFKNSSQPYFYPKEKGPFRQLKLADKVRELKAFLTSAEITSLYQNQRPPELVDVEDLTVYVQVPYSQETERALLEEMHERGVEIFCEDELNFIPEA